MDGKVQGLIKFENVDSIQKTKFSLNTLIQFKHRNSIQSSGDLKISKGQEENRRQRLLLESESKGYFS